MLDFSARKIERLSATLALQPKPPKNIKKNYLIYIHEKPMERKTKIECLYLQSRLTCLVMKECELIEGFDSDQSNQKQGKILLSTKLAYHESMT